MEDDDLIESSSLFHERYQMQTPISDAKLNVRLAWDSYQKRSVVIKSFTDVQQAQLEFTALSKLKGTSNTMQLLDTYSTDCLRGTEWCIVCEYAENGTLLDVLEKLPSGHFEGKQLINVTKQLLSGLFQMHMAGIMHGDIKPSNILCRSNGTVAFCDFGMSTVTGYNTNTQMLNKCSGTPAFVAPEIITIGWKSENIGVNDSQSRCKSHYDGFAADIWSLGVTLYLMAVGALPFDDDTQIGMFQKIISCQLHFPSKFKLSRSFQQLIRCMLSKDPKLRATAAELLVFPLQ